MNSVALFWRVLSSIMLAGFLLLGLTGCSNQRTPFPATYPVKGKVANKDGLPVNGGVIEFRASSDPATTMMSNIQADGSFELFTIFGIEKLSGGIAGPSQVTIHPPIIPGTAPSSHVLMKLVTIEPQDNYFTIQIPPERQSQ